MYMILAIQRSTVTLKWLTNTKTVFFVKVGVPPSGEKYKKDFMVIYPCICTPTFEPTDRFSRYLVDILYHWIFPHLRTF
jgi:hypothetical protein